MQNPIIHPEAARLLRILTSIKDRLERPWDSQYPIRGKGKPGEPIKRDVELHGYDGEKKRAHSLSRRKRASLVLPA
jgi:hypothetical protein